MQDLTVTLIQAELAWEDIQENLDRFDTLLYTVSKPTDLIILPEMFSTAFTMNPSPFAESMEGKTMQWMEEKAKEKNAIITGSIIIKEDKKYFNRLIWMPPDGKYEYYDKAHLFRLAGEQDVYTSGNKQKQVQLKGWSISLNICYDLRFPVWCRNRPQNMFDLQLFVANWPQRRALAWNILLQSRAVENQAYVIGLNRVGKDGNEVSHSGDSLIIHPAGDILFTQPDFEIVKTITLSKEELLNFRAQFQFYKDTDEFELLRCQKEIRN